MPQQCKICAHPEREQIEQLLRTRSPIRTIADQKGLSLGVINRHKASHMQPSSPMRKRIIPSADSRQKKNARKVLLPASHARLSDEERDGAQKLFLADYAEWGNVRHACAAAGIARNTLVQWKEHDDAFVLAYHQAELDADDTLRAEARRRGVVGTETYVVSQGKLVMVEDEQGHTVPLKEIKYSDNLLMFHMKARMPEYRDKQQVELSGTNGGPIQTQSLQGLTDEELASIKAMLQAAVARHAEPNADPQQRR